MVSGFNLSGALNFFKLAWNPRLCLPDVCVSNFNELPIPLHPKVKAIVLDKDNCFAAPHDDKVWPEYSKKWKELRSTYPDKQLLIVSNTAGTSDDYGHEQAKILEGNTKVAVLRHSLKKPGCRDDILAYFYKDKIINSPDEIAVVGDRLLTDIVMANQMGARGFWIRDGVKPSDSAIVKLEKKLYDYLRPDS